MIEGDTLAVLPISYIVNANIHKAKCDSIVSENFFLTEINNIMCTQIVNYKANQVDYENQLTTAAILRLTDNQINELRIKEAKLNAKKFEKRYKIAVGTSIVLAILAIIF